MLKLIDLLGVVTDDYMIYVYMDSDLFLWRGKASSLADALRNFLNYFVGTLLVEQRKKHAALIVDIYEPEYDDD